MPKKPTPYQQELTAADAAAAMQAARFNALDLVDSAELLFTHKRFAHSVLLATLAIEETAKVELLMATFLGLDDRAKLWRAYRRHEDKTRGLNRGIEGRIRATFPQIPPAAAQAIGQRGPTPELLEKSKQQAVYSDCLNVDGGLVVHLPRNVDWRSMAWERLCEAQALAFGLRDYPPEELEVWLRHAEAARASGGGFASILRALHDELLERGFIKAGQWDAVLDEPDETGNEPSQPGGEPPT